MAFVDIEREFEERLDQCWLSVMVADVAQLAAFGGWTTLSRDVRASAAVLAVAEFEALVKDCVEEMHAAIEGSGRAVADLKDGIRFLHRERRIATAGDSDLDAAWAARMELARSHLMHDAPLLPRRDGRGNLQPVGSRTPRPAMLVRLWTVYELPGAPFPRLDWQRALGELADIRNDVAHRRLVLRLAMTGKGRSADAIAQHISDLRALGLHALHTIQDYVTSGAFAL